MTALWDQRGCGHRRGLTPVLWYSRVWGWDLENGSPLWWRRTWSLEWLSYLLRKQMRTAKPELQESVNKHGDESWEALFGQEAYGLVQQSLGCLWGSALRVPLPQFLGLGFFSLCTKQKRCFRSFRWQLWEGSVILQKRFWFFCSPLQLCHQKRAFGSGRINLYCLHLFNLVVKNESQWSWQT